EEAAQGEPQQEQALPREAEGEGSRSSFARLQRREVGRRRSDKPGARARWWPYDGLVRDLFFLTCGHFRVPSFAIDPPRLVPSPLARQLSNTVAVVVRESGDVLLVDCGWSEEACADPRGVIGRAR